MTEIEILKKLGMTEYESQISFALLKLGASKVSDLTKKCPVPKNKIYECLDNLSRKGVVQVIPSNPKKYFIKEINSLKILINQKEEDLEQLKREFLQLKKIKQDKLLQSVTEPISIIYGHEAFLSKIKEAIQQVSRENLVLAKKVRTDAVLLRLTEQAIKKGVKVKIIFPKIDLDKVKEWKKAGAKIKFLDNMPEIVFSTFDDKICRLNINLSDNLSDPTLWIENKQFVNILREKFIKLWKEAKI